MTETERDILGARGPSRAASARRQLAPGAVWQRGFVEQVAAAWILSCVFVRTLEDRDPKD